MKLTRRELQVLTLIQEGLTTKEVASRLQISTRTVETYRRNINEKLQVRNVTAALCVARRLYLIE
ncbi:MAG: response regulator transcription factor [Chitinophagaceae bacterium]|nr:response regulator transcription factor [Chitinophagaceae bacterium]